MSNDTIKSILEDDKYDKVVEGKAKVYFPKTKNQVFYNPIQEFNRDLSIAVINTYSSEHENKKISLLEALAASGIRSMRYALEIKNINEIIANDFDQKAVELIDVNIKLNEVAHIVKSNYDDAISLMNQKSRNKKMHFDCIDLDPYGSPSIFLDSAIRSVKNGGLLLVTATDAGPLCGNGVDSCYTKYGSLSLRTPCCHELGIRILLQSINSHAIRHSKYIVPILSLSIDFYFRLFVLVFDSQMKAKESVSNIGFFYVCSSCNSFFQQDFGKSVPTNGNVKFVPNTEAIPNVCSNCNGKMKIAGPVWTGILHDNNFVTKVIENIKESTVTTKDRILGMLNLVIEELPNPLYYVLDDICSVMHCETPNHNVFRSALMNANYQVSYSHCSKNSFKTDAPSEVIWNLLREWVKIKPINQRWLTSEYTVTRILKKESNMKFDFTIRQDSIPASKKNKMVRFHEPPPFWGPKSKPKRKAEKDANDPNDQVKKLELIDNSTE